MHASNPFLSPSKSAVGETKLSENTLSAQNKNGVGRWVDSSRLVGLRRILGLLTDKSVNVNLFFSFTHSLSMV